jgi:hypothetical protein
MAYAQQIIRKCLYKHFCIAFVTFVVAVGTFVCRETLLLPIDCK